MTGAGRLLLVAVVCGADWSPDHRDSSPTLYRDCRVYDNTTWFGGEVCGSDGITYPNSLYLRCLNYQQPQRRVTVAHTGHCVWTGSPCPYSPLYNPVCGSDGHTYANDEALTCRCLLYPPGQAVRLRHAGECYRQRPCRRAGGQSAPVCASNGFTYPRLDDVACLRSMGAGLHVRHEGGCTLEEVKGLVGSQYHACLIVRTHAEWNPVCGPNSITYPSPLLVFCRRPDTWAWLPGECGSDIHYSCSRAAFDRDCAPGVALRPVCGSNGHTYNSAEELLCASRCNKYLHMRHSGHCQAQDDPCWRNGDLSDGGTPVCGSDGISYVTPAALWCSRKRYKPYLKYLHDGPCLAKSGMLY